MDITASSLHVYNRSNRTINQQFNGLLKSIQSSILDASKNGQTEIKIPVPINFENTNINNKTTQTIIYSRLISELKKNGFKVGVYINKDNVIYYIKWLDSISDGLGAMRELIASHKIN